MSKKLQERFDRWASSFDPKTDEWYQSLKKYVDVIQELKQKIDTFSSYSDLNNAFKSISQTNDDFLERYLFSSNNGMSTIRQQLILHEVRNRINKAISVDFSPLKAILEEKDPHKCFGLIHSFIQENKYSVIYRFLRTLFPHDFTAIDAGRKFDRLKKEYEKELFFDSLPNNQYECNKILMSEINHQDVYLKQIFFWFDYEKYFYNNVPAKQHQADDLEDMSDIITLLKYKKQIILQGPPGTGKTREAKLIAKEIIKSNLINNKKVGIKNLTKEFIQSNLRINQKIEGKNKTMFEVVSIEDNVVILKSDVSKPWRPSYNKIIESFNSKLWEVKNRTGGYKPYEDAIAKYVYENHFSEINEIEENIVEEKDFLCLIQFHPSYTYEDFVRGIVAKPNESGEGILYVAENKILGGFAENAFNDPCNNYIVLIDEINRANLSSVLGELIYALEYRGEAVESMYAVDDDNKLILPSNLYIIGTMNTADRSVGHIDYAIRRRFAFVDVFPKDLSEEEGIAFDSVLFNQVAQLFDNYLSPEFEKKDVQLGHSYFIDKSKDDDGVSMAIRLEYEIKPILVEYAKDGVLIGNDIKQKIEELTPSI